MADTGGKVAPDGRPPVAPGVGKNARRHDLEAPATPGLSNSDLQQGDVSRLEASQRIAPISKRTQPSAAPQPASRNRTTTGAQGDRVVPDPIEMAGSKIGGQIPSNDGVSRPVDTSAWLPLAEQMAFTPNAGGTIVAQLANQLSQYRQRPVVSRSFFIDVDEMDETIGSL